MADPLFFFGITILFAMIALFCNMDVRVTGINKLLWVIIYSLTCMLVYSCQPSIARIPAEKEGLRIMDSLETERYRVSFSGYFDSLLNHGNFSGGILVAKNGVILYEHYQGDVYGDKLKAIDEHTPFNVASTSKTITSIAILQLESRGLLSLDDTIGKFWPDIPYTGISIRNLLNHSSGIPDYAYFLPSFGWDNKITATNYDVLDILTLKKPSLDFRTGSRFKYCNTNYVLLALLVEKLSGFTYPHYVKENIFEVAGMQDSYILSAYNQGDYMPSWTEGGRMYSYDYLDGIYGDKNVFTTCRDLMKYDNAIRTGLILDPQLYNVALQPNFRDTKYHDPWEYYGLGWRLKVFDNNLTIAYHNGWWHGNNAVFQRLLADTAVIIVTGNRMNKRIYASARAANLFRAYYPESSIQPVVMDNEMSGGDPGALPGKDAGSDEQVNHKGEILHKRQVPLIPARLSQSP